MTPAKPPATAAGRRFSAPILAALSRAKIIGLRAGIAPHRFLGVWVVVVRDRAFVRPWNDRPDGWRRVFRNDPRGAMQLGTRTIGVLARPARGERLWDEIDDGYAEKYPTPGSRGYVRGFAQDRRRRTTVELVPRSSRAAR